MTVILCGPRPVIDLMERSGSHAPKPSSSVSDSVWVVSVNLDAAVENIAVSSDNKGTLDTTALVFAWWGERSPRNRFDVAAAAGKAYLRWKDEQALIFPPRT